MTDETVRAATGEPVSLPLPMFPLGSVLLPGMPLPLRAFEPRYRALVEDCLKADGRFGVVLIERGHEVGGGDQRCGFGTVARIVDAAKTDTGEWVLVAVGESRFHVRTWLPDDPYPVALVEHAADVRLPVESLEQLGAVERTVRRCLSIAGELGDEVVPPSVKIDADLHVAAWQLAGIAPLSTLDRQRLLEIDDPVARLDRLGSLAEDMAEVLAYRLAGGT